MGDARHPSLAIFLPSLRGGGAERACLYLAQALCDRGETIDLVVGQREGPLGALIPPAVRLIDLESSRVSRSIPAIAGYLRDARPHALISALSHLNLAVLWACRLAGVHSRVIITERNPLSFLIREEGARDARWIPLLARLTYPQADAVVAISRGVADDLARVTRLDRRRIHVIYNPVPADRIRAWAEEDPGYGWLAQNSRPVVLGVGRLTRQKDFGTLVSAFASLRESRDARLVILGEGPRRPELQAQIDALGLSQVATLPGFFLNPYPAMKRSAVLALTSAWEGFGNVLVEAMALGTPVVATLCPGGVAEILNEGTYGRLAAVGDAQGVAEAIASTLDHPPPADLLTSRADDFSPDKSANAYLDLVHG